MCNFYVRQAGETRVSCMYDTYVRTYTRAAARGFNFRGAADPMQARCVPTCTQDRGEIRTEAGQFLDQQQGKLAMPERICSGLTMLN